ncbi:coiled-coil domain-containing protein 106-like [Pygocentrus nattereri]|uniref:coiled-coil domain-containing protein 106-like n=1 Tax=Pygocentrus nattereri TaxID=42514 RepID=UPI0008142461|nr:coiled-coil domain-containing protein 106-like [Pygocentrus nattereri]
MSRLLCCGSLVLDCFWISPFVKLASSVSIWSSQQTLHRLLPSHGALHVKVSTLDGSLLNCSMNCNRLLSPTGKTKHIYLDQVQSGNPQQAVRRYRKILQQYKRGKNLHAAYKAVGVDRNTVVANAPIAELAIVAPQEYSKLLESYSRQEKLQVFAKKCMDILNNDVQLLTTVEMYKKKNKFLPLMKRK